MVKIVEFPSVSIQHKIRLKYKSVVRFFRLRTHAWTVKRVYDLRDKLIPGWLVVWDGDPWCQFNKKVIHMEIFKSHDMTMQCFLHEVCHAHRGMGGHPEGFWNDLAELVKLYLFQDLNSMQLMMKGDYLKPMSISSASETEEAIRSIRSSGDR